MQIGKSYTFLLPLLSDIDTESDWAQWQESQKVQFLHEINCSGTRVNKSLIKFLYDQRYHSYI